MCHLFFRKPPKYPPYPLFEMTELLKPELTRVTEQYTGQRRFDSLEDALGTLSDWALRNQIRLRKGSGNNKVDKNGFKRKVVLVCQFSGKSKQTAPHDSDKKLRIVKTSCPFRINLNFRDKQSAWFITKMVIKHNHP